MQYLSLLALASIATTVSSHGVITSPTPRIAGTVSLAACGSGVTDLIEADVTSHVEGLPEAAAVDPDYHANECNLWLCKGLQLDTAASGPVQTYRRGQVVPIEVFIRVRHTGTANVSIVDTKSNTIIGDQLLYFDDYADTGVVDLPANNTAFSITIPRNIKRGKCTRPGECVC